jgi:hypothetical protein
MGRRDRRADLKKTEKFIFRWYRILGEKHRHYGHGKIILYKIGSGGYF